MTAAAVKPIRDGSDLLKPMRLIVPSDLGIQIPSYILQEPYSSLHPPTILKDIKQQTMWIIGCGLFVRKHKHIKESSQLHNSG